MAWRVNSAVNEGAALDEMMLVVLGSSSNTDSKAIKLISFNDYNFIIISSREGNFGKCDIQSSVPSSSSATNEISWFHGQKIEGSFDSKLKGGDAPSSERF